jgi:hypothetical protein
MPLPAMLHHARRDPLLAKIISPASWPAPPQVTACKAYLRLTVTRPGSPSDRARNGHAAAPAGRADRGCASVRVPSAGASRSGDQAATLACAALAAVLVLVVVGVARAAACLVAWLGHRATCLAALGLVVLVQVLVGPGQAAGPVTGLASW